MRGCNWYIHSRRHNSLRFPKKKVLSSNQTSHKGILKGNQMIERKEEIEYAKANDKLSIISFANI